MSWEYRNSYNLIKLQNEIIISSQKNKKKIKKNNNETIKSKISPRHSALKGLPRNTLTKNPIFHNLN